MTLREIEDLYREQASPETILEAFMDTDINGKDDNYRDRTPLHLACSYADANAILYLLAHGAGINVRDNEGNTPLCYLGMIHNAHDIDERRLYQCATILLNAKASLPRSGKTTTALLQALWNSNYGMADAFIDSGIRLDSTDSSGRNALHIAAAKAASAASRINRCEELIKDFATRWYPEKQKEQIQQDLADARQEEQRNYLTVKALLGRAGLDPDEKDNCGKKPLTDAIDGGAKLAGALLAGKDPATDPLAARTGGMDMFQALARKDTEAVEALLESGAELQTTYDESVYYNYKGLSPLGCALWDHSLTIASLLLQAGADPNYRDATGKTAIAHWLDNDNRSSYKTQDPYTPLLLLLKEKGWQAEAPATSEGETAFSLACHSDTKLAETLFRHLLENGAKVNSRDNRGRTPLLHLCKALESNYLKILEPLLEARADIHATDNAGNTPLHYLADHYGNEAKNAAEILFDFGTPDTAAVNNEGQTPLDIATERNNEILVKWLLNNS